MPSNRELIQSLYDAFGRGDAGTVLGAFHPDIVWNEAEGFVYADRNPYRGPSQVAEGVFGRLATEWEGFTVSPQTLLQDGETVVALGRYRGTFRATGRRLDAQFAHVWTVKDGRVSQFQQYTDTAQSARVTDPAGMSGTAAADD
ncbi:MAG TPA: nuclear transport factor 2 family protein [Gemmatimonadaceae bacterium]|jgi:hypothetical protein|nr:nuclear transport factor 2 family protein [Gemmatimonadaceae bacterium]